MKRLIIVLLAMVILTSCSVNKRIAAANRYSHNPYFGENYKRWLNMRYNECPKVRQ